MRKVLVWMLGTVAVLVTVNAANIDFRRADSAWRDGDHAEALRLVQRCLERRPDHQDGLFLLGRLLLERGDFAAVRACAAGLVGWRNEKLLEMLRHRSPGAAPAPARVTPPLPCPSFATRESDRRRRPSGLDHVLAAASAASAPAFATPISTGASPVAVTPATSPGPVPGTRRFQLFGP